MNIDKAMQELRTNGFYELNEHITLWTSMGVVNEMDFYFERGRLDILLERWDVCEDLSSPFYYTTKEQSLIPVSRDDVEWMFWQMNELLQAA